MVTIFPFYISLLFYPTGINAATLGALPSFGAAGEAAAGAFGAGGPCPGSTFTPPTQPPQYPPPPPPPSHAASFSEGWTVLNIDSSMRPRAGSTPFSGPSSQLAVQANGTLRKGSDPGMSRLLTGEGGKDLPPELRGVSVKELVKALGELNIFCHIIIPQMI